MRRHFTREAYSHGVWAVLGAIFLFFLAYLSSHFVGTLVVGFFLYYATRPFYHTVKRLLRNSTISAVISMGIVTLPGVVAVLYAASIAYQEAYRAANRHDSATLEPFLDPVLNLVPVESAEAVVQGILSPYQVLADGLQPEVLPQLLNTVLDSLSVLGTVGLNLFIALIFAFYLLRDGHRLKTIFVDDLDMNDSLAAEYARAVDTSFHKVFYGNILNSVVTAIIAASVFNALNFISPIGLGIPYPTLLGILSGLASLIPFIGMKLVFFPLTAYISARILMFNAYEFAWFPIVVFFVSWVVADAIPDLFLRPYISSGSLHMGALMLAYITGPMFFGWYGLFLGPMILVGIIHFVKIVLPALIGPRHTRLDSY